MRDRVPVRGVVAFGAGDQLDEALAGRVVSGSLREGEEGRILTKGPEGEDLGRLRAQARADLAASAGPVAAITVVSVRGGPLVHPCSILGEVVWEAPWLREVRGELSQHVVLVGESAPVKILPPRDGSRAGNEDIADGHGGGAGEDLRRFRAGGSP